jgi:hypothetical protein
MKGQLMISIGKFPIFAACLAAVSSIYFVSQRSYSAEQTVSAQWLSRGSSREPVIDMPNTYSYESSALQDAPGRWKVWFCGGDTVGRLGDSIFYTVVDTRTMRAEKPVRVLASEVNDTAEDGQHACSPSVIKHGGKSGAETYLLYYECAPRVYDRSRNLSRIESFTQICAATSNDGTRWEKHNGPILKAAERVLNNCSYTFAGGKRSIDAGKPSCSDANLINNYGAGHPSAIVINNGAADVIWLFYYDSKGDWPDHGVYLVKGEDGLTFANPVKTNLPNGARVKYFSGRFGSWDHVFIAATIIDGKNLLLVSNDGINWLPAGGSVIEMGRATKERCVAPGQGEIVGDAANNLTSLSVSFLSAEGYLGMVDQGQKLGCYSQSEDRSRGSTWKIYVMQGEIKPVARSP